MSSPYDPSKPPPPVGFVHRRPERELAFAEPGLETREPIQAERILARFGGASRLHAILAELGHPLAHATLYKWTYPKERGGTGGFIPTSAWPLILKAAAHEGIILTSDDMDPREIPLSASYVPTAYRTKRHDL